jgi:ABC-type branched-subunit amino acid transport system ATPase component
VPMLFRMTDRFIILEKGQIAAEGTREQVAASEVMKEYLAI